MTVLGLDVGGTALKAVAVARDGTILGRAQAPTDSGAGHEAVIDNAVGLLDTLREALGADRHTPESIGVVVPGIVDEAAGIATFSANLGWREVPVRRLLESRLGVPVTLGHDVRAGALAEGAVGAARAVQEYAFLAIGTGIAAALVLEGRLWRGGHGLAGELGHVQAETSGAVCGCGRRGCLETVASAAAIARRYNARARAGSDLDAAGVWARRAQEDPVAVEVWAEAIDALGRALAQMQTIVDIDLIVLGGGLARAGEELLEMLASDIGRRLAFEHRPRLALAALGDEAGCIGAAMLAARRSPG
jgi:glucokinase